MFHRSMTEELKWQEDHHITFKRLKRIAQYNLLPPELLTEKHHFSPACANALAMYDLAFYIKKSLAVEVSFLFHFNSVTFYALLKYLFNIIILGLLLHIFFF